MRMNRFAVPGISQFVVVLAFGAALVCIPTPGFATPILASAQSFSVLGASTVTNTGTTTLWGDVGVYAGTAITGESSLTVDGVSALSSANVHAGDAVAQQAQIDALGAYTALAALP